MSQPSNIDAHSLLEKEARRREAFACGIVGWTKEEMQAHMEKSTTLSRPDPLGERGDVGQIRWDERLEKRCTAMLDYVDSHISTFIVVGAASLGGGIIALTIGLLWW